MEDLSEYIQGRWSMPISTYYTFHGKKNPLGLIIKPVENPSGPFLSYNLLNGFVFVYTVSFQGLCI